MIGRWIDHTVDHLIVGAGTLANRLLESAWPAHPGADRHDCEVFEPLGEYPEVPPMLAAPRQVLLDAVCEVLAEHHPINLPSNGEVRCFCDDYMADRQDWREHVAPLILDNLPTSAPGAPSCSAPVAADAPSPAPPPRGAGSGHSTSDLLMAAANQITAYKRGLSNDRYLGDDRYLADYLAELVPELRDRAAQFEAHGD